MAYAFGNRTLNKVGVVGSGQIGPDIALHITKVMSRAGVPVVVVDISEEALAAGEKRLHKKIDKGVESRAFKPEQAEAMKANTTFTSDYEQLRGADFVIEAASEDLGIKHKVFAQLEELCAPGAILASNSSHLEPERIFSKTKDPSRTLVIHYFFPAERNPGVEIVPGMNTSEDVAQWIMGFYENVGKVPIRVGSRYGYAVDPVFEGLFQAAVLCVEEGLGTVKQVDSMATQALGLGVGPFTAMNLTGGNPLTLHGLDQYHELLNPWFRAPQLLKDQVASGEPWDGVKRGETVEVSPEAQETITERLQGAYLGLVTEILQSGISNVADLDMELEIALVVRAPFRMMNNMGVERALELVRKYAADHESFPVPQVLVEQARSGKPWDIPVVLREDRDGIAVLTIRRPRVLNALNQDVFSQLDHHFAELQEDDSVSGVVLTGFGTKAFVSGADVGMLAKIDSPQKGEETSWSSHKVLNRIAAMHKPVVCAYNGMAFGGGNELALACHARIARKGLKVLAAQPEPNLGIIPGAGATQRLPRVIGFKKAWEMLRTGAAISGAEAEQLGLIQAEVEGDLVAAAAELARKLATDGFEPAGNEPFEPPSELPEVDLGHLSRAVDSVLQKAVLEGNRLPLDEGLRFEAQCFGEVCALEDMRIGVQNFMRNGPRAKAEFVNR
ncbi:MAG: 3-hydroxyacyl-CoA dehydrogenase/enoyl-CoA hydratase family protein [Planctomycetota bacterium]